jgi:hypothetical protein
MGLGVDVLALWYGAFAPLWGMVLSMGIMGISRVSAYIGGFVCTYTNNLRTALLLRGVISSSPAGLALSGRGYAELRLNGVLRSTSLLRVTRKKYEGRAIPGEESPALLVPG